MVMANHGAYWHALHLPMGTDNKPYFSSSPRESKEPEGIWFR